MKYVNLKVPGIGNSICLIEETPVGVAVLVGGRVRFLIPEKLPEFCKH